MRTGGSAVTDNTARVSRQPVSADLGRLATYHARKTPGSIQYYKVWRTWIDQAVRDVQRKLLEHLSLNDAYRHCHHIGDKDSARQFSARLGTAADAGSMPSFADADARVDYATGYVGRVRLLANLLFHWDVQPPLFRSTLKRLMQPNADSEMCSPTVIRRLTSIGGGPGFDFCAAALVAALHNARGSSTAGQPVSIDATVLDFEIGWSALVEQLSEVTKAILVFDEGTDHVCRFGGKCDITQPLNHVSNVALIELLDTTDIWTCQYCVHENASLLLERKFVFFRELFASARDGSLFLFTDTSHRLWPVLLDISLPHGYEVAFIHGHGRWKAGYQMVLRKGQQGSVTNSDLELCEQFRRDAEMHQRKLAHGYKRPKRRVPEQR